MSSGGGTPASLSWRVGGRSSPQHQRNTSSSLASAVLPAISIALPGGSNASSSASSSSSKLPMSSSSGGERGGEDPSSSTDDAGDSENPQLQQQQPNHHHSHSPFHIGPLRTDGKSGDDKRKQRSKVRKRDKLARAGRSLSPFRSMHGRSSSLNRLGEALASVRLHHHATSNQLLSPPKSGQASSSRTPSDDAASTTSGGEATEDDSTDTESVRSVGLAPRDTAFGSGRGGTGGDGDGEDDSGEHEDGEQRSSLDASESPSEGEGQAADDDSIIDFDDATIDNTLFNAGCLDLHNAWQNNKESIGEGGWYPDENDPSWDTTNDDDEAASRKLHHDASRHEGAMVDDPDDEGYTYQGTRTAPVDGAAPLTTSGDHEEVSSPSHIDHHSRLPNVILPSSHRPPAPTKQGSKYISSSSHGNGKTPSTSSEYSLVASRPIFAKNRCTITLVHGEYEKAVAEREQSGQGRMPRRWIVASDGSEESSYAIEWTIGTVLRDGDETLIVSVMETSEKLDGSHAPTSAAGKAALKEKQRIRQSMALVLARQATALLQRTRLAVKVSCQALHAKHARHMLLDLIDFYEPTMVIVGSRGLGSLKGILLGSTSHYLLQRSSKPIMIARKRLQLPALPRGKGDVVSSVRRRHMRLDEAAIEKKSKVGEEGEDGEGETSEDDDAAAGQGQKTATDDKGENGEDSKEQGSSGDTVTQRREDDKARERTSAESAELRKEGQAAVAGKEEERLRESGDGEDQAEATVKGPSSSEGEAATSSSAVAEDDATATPPSSVAAAASEGPSEKASKASVGEERGRRESAARSDGAAGEEEERGRSRSRARDR